MAFNGSRSIVFNDRSFLVAFNLYLYDHERGGGREREKQREKQRMRERGVEERESFTRIEYRDDRTLLLIMANNHRALFRGARN